MGTINQDVLFGDAKISVYHLLPLIQRGFCQVVICEFTGLKLHVVRDHE